jgi:peptidyl-prolyl cis-trans isomerase SurA
MRTLILSMFLVLVGEMHAQPPGKLIDKVIGVAGGEILLHSELEASILELTEGRGGGTTDDRCSAYENLMYQKLLLNQSKLDSIEVTDAEVNAQVQRRLEYFVQMFGSVEEFEKYYGKSQTQLKDEYFDLIRDQLLVQRMSDNITKNVRVTPADVLRYYNGVPKDSIPLIGEQVEFSKIQIDPKVRETERSRVIQLLDSIRVNLVNGRSSMTLEAAKWSEDPGSRYKGGCYPLQRKGSFVPEYEAAVYNTPEGTFSPVFSSVYGYHFVKVVERRGEFYEACHILMSPKILAEDLNIARKTLEDILPILRDSMDFQKAAAKYSTNEDTRNQGGKVINPATGGTRHDVAGLTSELNLILMSMKPGEISDPVLFTADDNSQSYVVYKLDNRIPAHLANMKDDYEIFRQVAENKAKVEETDKWVKKKIGATYILVDPDYLTCITQFPWVKNKP